MAPGSTPGTGAGSGRRLTFLYTGLALQQQRAEDLLDNEGANAMGFWLGDGWYRGRLGFDGGYQCDQAFGRYGL